MIRHVVAFTFREDVDEEGRQRVIDELNGFPSLFPAMRRFALAPNISRRDDSYTHAFVVEFGEESELLAYLDSAEHLDFIANRWRPVIERRAIVSIDVDGSDEGAR